MPKVQSELSWLAGGSPAAAIFRDPAKKPPASAYGLYPTLEEEGSRPKRTVTTRGTEIFVAKGSEIRCSDLQVLKALSSENNGGPTYQVLAIPEVNFEIEQLEVSEDGAFLAIAGESRIGVCLLPSRESMQAQTGPLKTKYWEIGSSYHGNSDSSIVRILWHPYSEGGSLIVLTSDSYLRLYDLQIQNPLSFLHPEQTIDFLKLAGRSRTASSFCPDALDYEPASCTFASGQDLWRPFTLYILMRGGDVYGLCPLIPSRWFLPHATFMEDIKAELDLKREELGNKDSPSKLEKIILRQEIKWTNDIFEQLRNLDNPSDVTNGTRGVKQEWLTRPKSFDSTPALQGPFLMRPEPEFVDAYGCDIFHLYTSAATLVGILWSSGRVDICTEPDILEPRFALSPKHMESAEDDSILPILNPHESIQLDLGGAKGESWPIFVPDTHQGTSFFVFDWRGVVSINMTDWLGKLKTLSQADVNEHYLAKELDSLAGSEVERVTPRYRHFQYISDSILKDSRETQGLTGAIAVTNPYIGHILLVSAKESVLAYELEYSGNLYKSELEEALVNVTKAAPERKKTVYPEYKPLIKLPLFETPRELAAPPLIFEIHKKFANQGAYRAPLHYSTATLKVLRSSHKTLEKEFDGLKPIIEELYDRAHLQQEEFNLQVRKARELNEKIDKMQSSNIKERLRLALERQDKLKARADELLRKAVMSGSPALSDAEKKWSEEVTRVDNKVNSANGFAAKIKRMEAWKSQLLASTPVQEERDLGKVLHELQVNPEFRHESTLVLTELLRKEQKLVEGTKEMIRDLEKRIEAL